MIKGTWETNMCTYGRVQAFHVAKAAYLGALRKCKAMGYTAAQPSESTFGGWYPFKVGNVITGYFYKADITQFGVYYPTTSIPACGAGNGPPVVIPNDDFAGGDTAYPVCVKCCRMNSWDWLYKSKGILSSTYYTVQGQWVNHLCGFGYMKSFRISSADYNKFLKMCKDQGYETLQVAKTSSDIPSPVQVGNFYGDTYIVGTKYPAMPVPDCVASNDGAGSSDSGKSLYLYCIGHSLGGQICGQAGRQLNGSFNISFDRITALDPASPAFEECKKPLAVDKSCAICVDVIHTNAHEFRPEENTFYLGCVKPSGHVDFYPHGGAAQPGCTAEVAQFLKIDYCSHRRAALLFTATVLNRNACVVYGPCPDTILKNTGLCTPKLVQRLGYYSPCHRGMKSLMEGIYYSKERNYTKHCQPVGNFAD